MTSFSGSVAYLHYVSGTKKGDVDNRDFNGVFKLGQMDEARQNYTADMVIETLVGGKKVGLTPRVCGKFFNKVDGNYYDAKLVIGNVEAFKNAAELKDFVATEETRVYYFANEFNIEAMPAGEKIASIRPVMERIPLVAEARRIAVKYDQITAYQAKTDYGFSLDKQIAEQACGELAY